MSELIAKTPFEKTVNYVNLPKTKLLELFHFAITAHRNFFLLWQTAIIEEIGEEVDNDSGEQITAQLTAKVYPNLSAASADTIEQTLERVFYEEMNFLWTIMPDMSHMLTFANYKAELLPPTLDQSLNVDNLSNESLLLLWNLSTLTYVMQTDRWTKVLTSAYGQATALKIEKQVWVERGGAEEDLRYGLQAAGAETGNVETLLRGFQMAPGEVGLVDAEFSLDNPDHGWITHRHCPAHEMMRDSNKERLENSCVICVIAMRLSGEMVNEKIRCRPASLPPHRQPCDHACRWEYWVEG